LHLARKPPLEKEQEKDKRIPLQTTLPQEIPNLHETPNQTNPHHTQHSPNSQFPNALISNKNEIKDSIRNETQNIYTRFSDCNNKYM